MNQVELAVCQLSRVQGQIFTLYAGSHTSIKGHHTMYYNKPDFTCKVFNYYKQYANNQQEASNNESHNNDESTETDDNSNSGNNNIDSTADLNIQVVLTGPFTIAQRQIARSKTTVCIDKVIRALKWLQKHNVLYRDYNFDENNICEPQIIDLTYTVESQDTNIEKGYSTKVVFVDHNPPTEYNGGYDTTHQFIAGSLQNLLGDSNTLQIRSSSNILRHYEDQNLYKSFPDLFPYGIGPKSIDNAKFYKHLLSLSNVMFHRGEVTTVIQNIYERMKMFKSTVLYTKKDRKIKIGQLKEDDFTADIERHLANKDDPYYTLDNNGPISTFLKSVQATTRSMSHTEEAAKAARRRMLALAFHFGVPSLMFTISPSSLFSFRIKIMSCWFPDKGSIPDIASDDNVLNEFAIDLEQLSLKYPGLAAIDFENILAITIHNLLKYGYAKPGLFGKILTYAFAVEEQNRGELHAHFLLWIKDFLSVMNGLGDLTKREEYEKMITDYTKEILSTVLHGETPVFPLNCTECSGMFTPCDNQSLRNLRLKKGVTEFGGKSIVKCTKCEAIYTSEDLAKQMLDKVFNIGMKPESSPLLYDNLWSKTQQKSKYDLMMQIHLMNVYVNELKTGKLQKYNSVQYTRNCDLTTTLRNLHKEEHSAGCFKFYIECRMKQPCRPSDVTHFIWETKEHEWYDWKGRRSTVNHFFVEHKREHADCFVNINNRVISEIFQCNTNVAVAVDGRSIMYITNYISKNTNKEDNAGYFKTAKILVSKLRKLHDSLNDDGNNNDNDSNNNTNNISNIQSNTDGSNNTIDDDDDDEEAIEKELCTRGIRTLMATTLMNTNTHVVSAPMATYLVRNGSRFGYAHEFQFISVKGFLSGCLDDIVLTSNYKGSTFIKSLVANYLCRAEELNEGYMCARFLLQIFYH